MRSIALPAASGLVGPATATSGSQVGLMGINITESATTAAAAHVRIRSGSSTGEIVRSIKVAASGTFDTTFQEAIIVGAQIYVQIVAGAVEGSLNIQ